MKMQRLVGWSVAIIALLLIGCTALLTKPERPEVTVASVILVEPGLLEQRYRVQLRVQNPNNIDLPIDGIQMRLELNNQPFVTAVSAAPVTVPRFSSALIEIDAVSTLARLLNQLKEITSGKTETVRYKLAGKIHLSQPSIELPFTQEGDISLAGVLGNTVK